MGCSAAAGGYNPVGLQPPVYRQVALLAEVFSAALGSVRHKNVGAVDDMRHVVMHQSNTPA